jgi:hypothetical protein
VINIHLPSDPSKSPIVIASWIFDILVIIQHGNQSVPKSDKYMSVL